VVVELSIRPDPPREKVCLHRLVELLPLPVLHVVRLRRDGRRRFATIDADLVVRPWDDHRLLEEVRRRIPPLKDDRIVAIDGRYSFARACVHGSSQRPRLHSRIDAHATAHSGVFKMLL